jgi:biotin synthase-related radical SAM superfamily protein
MTATNFKPKKFLLNAEVIELADFIFEEKESVIDSTLNTRDLANIAQEWIQDNGCNGLNRWSLCLNLGKLLKLAHRGQILTTKNLIQGR